MNDMEVEGSWKGRIWFLYFLWIFLLIDAAINFNGIELETTKDWLYLALFIVITILWIYGTMVLIKKFKDTFSK